MGRVETELTFESCYVFPAKLSTGCKIDTGAWDEVAKAKTTFIYSIGELKMI